MIADCIVHRNQEEGIRRFEIQHDLLPLANLIELAFREELDQTGNPIVTEMRRLASGGPLLWFLGGALAVLSPLMSGYVWIERGQLVGNVTLSLQDRHRGVWSINNVAVHPDCRGRGIARQLMAAALQEAHNRNAQWVVLEMQTNNLPAQRLYRQLGFEVYDTIAELSLPAHDWAKQVVPPRLGLRKRRPDDWQGLYDLLRGTTPAKAQETKPVLADNYRMGVERKLERLLNDLLHGRRTMDYVVEESGQIVAFLQITGQYTGAAHRLQLAVQLHSRGGIEQQLLAAALYELSSFPARGITSTVSLSHPEAHVAFRQAGFHEVRVLDQMRLNLLRVEEGTTP